MAWNQTNRFQSLDSSAEEFVDEKTRCCSVPRISCFERRNETNVRTDSSRAEPVSQRVPYSGSHKEDDEEYKSNSLRAFFASFERHVKTKTKKKVWTLPYERRPFRANSESASVKAKGAKTESHGFSFCISNFDLS